MNIHEELKKIPVFFRDPKLAVRLVKLGRQEVRDEESLRRLLEVASFYQDVSRAFEILLRAFSVNNQKLCDAPGAVSPWFVFSERSLYEKRIQVGTPRTIGALENALDNRRYTPPLSCDRGLRDFGGHPSQMNYHGSYAP